jgi:hypothetical protein
LTGAGCGVCVAVHVIALSLCKGCAGCRGVGDICLAQTVQGAAQQGMCYAQQLLALPLFSPVGSSTPLPQGCNPVQQQAGSPFTPVCFSHWQSRRRHTAHHTCCLPLQPRGDQDVTGDLAEIIDF